jgi:hypothetical protein
MRRDEVLKEKKELFFFYKGIEENLLHLISKIKERHLKIVYLILFQNVQVDFTTPWGGLDPLSVAKSKWAF